MSRIQRFIRICLSLLLIAFLGAKLDWTALGRIFASIDWMLFIVVLLSSPVLIILMAWRFQLLLRTQSISIPFAALLQMTWASQFFSFFLPGTTGGDVFKLYQIGRLAPQTRAAGAAAVVLDRLFALLALAALAAAAFLAEPAPILQLISPDVGVSRVAVLVVLGLSILILMVFLLRNWLTYNIKGVARFLNTLTEVLEVVRGGLRFNRLTAAAAVLALATHGGCFSAVFLVARALHIEITFLQTLLMMPVVLLVVMLPVTINGHGLREMVMIGYFGLLHIGGGSVLASGREMAVALSLACLTNDLGCALPGGIWHLLSTPPPPVIADHSSA